MGRGVEDAEDAPDDLKVGDLKAGASKHYHGHRERLRGRVLQGDGSQLADYELLELLLCAFIPRRDVKPIAKEMLVRFGSVSGALGATPQRLMEIDGIGETAAVYLRATHLLLQRTAGEEVKGRELISNWAALLSYVKVRLQHETTEQSRALYLDRKNKLIADEQLGRGTVDQAPVYPREVARRALELAASSVILVHNHPSGDPTPSRADIEMTRDVAKALGALEIRLHDHLVVGRGEAVSMKTLGLI